MYMYAWMEMPPFPLRKPSFGFGLVGVEAADVVDRALLPGSVHCFELQVMSAQIIFKKKHWLMMVDDG